MDKLTFNIKEKLTNKIKIHLILLGLAILACLFFGFKGNGEVTYYGASFKAGSVFLPASYEYSDYSNDLTYGIYSYAAREVNDRVSQKRKGSFRAVIISLCVTGGIAASLWCDDNFKDILVEYRRREAEK